MIRKNKNHLLIPIAIALLFSCRTLHPETGSQGSGNATVTAAHVNNSVGYVAPGGGVSIQGQSSAQEIANFDAKLSTAPQNVKAYFPTLVNGQWNYFNQFQVNLSKSDVPALTIMPVKNYVVDSVSIFNFNENTNTNHLLKLDTTRATCYGIKNNKVLIVLYPKYKDGKWVNYKGYSCVNPIIAQKLTELIAQKINVYNIDVIAFPSFHQISKTYVVFDNGKELISINPTGDFSPLKKELIKLNATVIDADKAWKNK